MTDQERKAALMAEYKELTGKNVPNQEIPWYELKIAEIKGEKATGKDNEPDESPEETELKIAEITNISRHALHFCGFVIKPGETKEIPEALRTDSRFIDKARRAMQFGDIKEA